MRASFFGSLFGAAVEQKFSEAFDLMVRHLDKEILNAAEKTQLKKALKIVTTEKVKKDHEYRDIKAVAQPVIDMYKENLRMCDEIIADLDKPENDDARKTLESDLNNLLGENEKMSELYQIQKLKLEEIDALLSELEAACQDASKRLEEGEDETSHGQNQLELAKLKKARLDRQRAEKENKENALSRGAHGYAAQAALREVEEINIEIEASAYVDELSKVEKPAESASLAARRAALHGKTVGVPSAAERLAALKEK